ncbi:MAG TPA: biosynthetic peptidoglycan transglycosylase [Ramlibacter sp.]
MKTVLIALSLLAALAVAAVAAGLLVLRSVLAPLPGEGSVPLSVGPWQMRAGVPSVLRLATSWWGGPLLQGRTFASRHGRLRFAWRDGHLEVHCAPCVLQPPGVGGEPLQLDDVQLSVHRLADHLSGEISAGAVRGRWQGDLAPDRLRLRVEVPSTPLADGYALFARQLPAVQRARSEGRFSLQAQFSLPAGTLVVTPRIEGFEVSGLGTEALTGARTACSRRASRLTADSWLARAVVAAEDQRFFEHPGYDLRELGAALSRNEASQRIERGASSLGQQLAKLLVTGEERTPVRKLRELLYAVEMERTLGKARILRLYLDNVPWGQGLCGAESAARHYFGVRPHELTPGQASWLAAMLHNPQLESQRWAATGQINLARAQWVALALRGMSRQNKLALAEDLGLVDWTPRWAEPTQRPLAGAQ